MIQHEKNIFNLSCMMRKISNVLHGSCFTNAVVISSLLLGTVFHIECSSFQHQLPMSDFFAPVSGKEANEEIFTPRILSRRKRHRRSSSPEFQEPVEVTFTALNRTFHFKLSPSTSPFSKESAVLIRNEGESSMVDLDPSVHSSSCLYRGTSVEDIQEKVALNFCGGFRGLLTSKKEYFIINPLPNQHRKVKRSLDDIDNPGPHVIFRRLRLPSQCSHLQSISSHDSQDRARGRFRRQESVDSDGKNYSHSDNSSSPGERDYLVVQQDTYFPSGIGNVADKIRFPGGAGEVADKIRFPGGAGEVADKRRFLENRRSMDWEEERQNSVERSYFPSQQERQKAWREDRFYIELAIFVDRDLQKDMAENFPQDTDQHIVQVVLAMINAVQLLYSDETLGANVEFLIKRLEILQTDPPNLHRSYDIDRYLDSFCKWQSEENAPSDSDPLHWDHALILTGLDVHVVGRKGKISNQVVGLAPVSGMCKSSASCTVNEGRHFESVYVMAHEIGHNLGMRHDGGEERNSCNPGAFIMSPTLGSGKITWSGCSRRYLHDFLSSRQARCLRDPSRPEVDHFHNPRRLPGERFPADMQCRLKYGISSFHSPQQRPRDLCRDLHCRRDHYTWTSHPALEGTKCGPADWCRRGACVPRRQKEQEVDRNSDPVAGGWSSWSKDTECASPCLFSPTGSLSSGSSGLVMATRSCSAPRPRNGGEECTGPSFRYTTCNAVRQCMDVPKVTVSDYSRSICQVASRHDPSILPYGDTTHHKQECSISCFTTDGDQVSRGWTFPDGTVCHLPSSEDKQARSFCIRGVCQQFTCSHDASYQLQPSICSSPLRDTIIDEEARAQGWTKWKPSSKCSFACLVPARGLQMVTRQCASHSCQGIHSTLRLCLDAHSSCSKLITPFQFATQTCTGFNMERLSGIGMQLESTGKDPDRACVMACQDKAVRHRFYMVSGDKGWFPYGTDCSRGVGEKEAYCVKGRCLEFGFDNTPLYTPFPEQDNEVLHSIFKRSLIINSTSRIDGSIDQGYLEQIIRDFNSSMTNNNNHNSKSRSFNQLFNFSNPVDVDELPQFDTAVLETNIEDEDSIYEESEEFVGNVEVVYSDGHTVPHFGLLVLLFNFIVIAVL